MKENGFERKMGLFTATMIGIGGTIGAGVFVLIGNAAGMAGPGVIFSFVLGAIITAFTALNYSELAASMPVAGGGYTFTKYSIGKFPAFITGWFMWFGNMFYSSLCAVGFAYALDYFIPNIHVPTVAILVILTFAAINLRGTKETGTAQNVLTITLITMLVVFIAAGFTNSFELDAFENWTPNGILPIFTTVGYIYVCYIGFEIISTASGEIKNPERNIPISIILAFTISAAIYCLMTLVAVGHVNWYSLGESPVPLTVVASKTMGAVGGIVMSATAILATLTSLNAAMIASARITYALGRDGYLPRSLTKVHKRFNTPYVAVILSSVLITMFAVSGYVDFLSYASDFGYIIGLTLINYSVVWARKKNPYVNRPFKVPFYPYIPIIGALTSFIVLPTLNAEAIGLGLLWAVFGLMIYYLIMLGRIRLRIAFGGITTGTGFITLAGSLLSMLGLIPLPVPHQLLPFLYLGLFAFAILQIYIGVKNIRS
jgi:amino acid transporter